MFIHLFLPFCESCFSLSPSLVISFWFFTEALKNNILITSRWKYKRAQLQKESNPSTFFTLSSTENLTLRAAFRKWYCKRVLFVIVLSITFEVITVVSTITFNDCWNNSIWSFSLVWTITFENSNIRMLCSTNVVKNI